MEETNTHVKNNTARGATNKTTTKKAEPEATKVENVQPQTDDRDNKIEQLQNQVNMLLAALSTMQAAPKSANNGDPTANTIKIVHLADRAPGLSTYIKLSNLVIRLTRFGEERTLTLSQFEELVGLYRQWFDLGIIAPGAGFEEIAYRYGLKPASEYTLTKEFLDKLGTLSLLDLENLYMKLCKGHRQFILEYWQRKIIEGNKAFKDIHKVELLNRLSDGELDNVLLDFKRESATK